MPMTTFSLYLRMAKMMTYAVLCIEIGKPNLFRQDFLAKPYYQSKQLLVLLSKRHFGGEIQEEGIKMLDLKK